MIEEIIRALQSYWLLLWVITIVLSTIIGALFIELRIARMYSVAVIGFRKSGKTTLIISLFGAILNGRIRKVRAALLTKSTIERVNSGMVDLQLGKQLGPTKDQDMFAFRTNIELGSRLKKKFKVEIGDFPGEMSEGLIDPAMEPMIHPHFETWVYEADAFIFVIDLAQLYLGYETNKGINREYAVKMAAAIRGAWQNILNRHSAGARKLKSYPVVLLFTKSDLLNYVSDPTSADMSWYVKTFGFKTLPGPPGKVQMDSQKFSKQRKIVTDTFSDLLSFFSQTNNNHRLIFSSSFGILDGNRLGFEEILVAIFGKPLA